MSEEQPTSPESPNPQSQPDPNSPWSVPSAPTNEGTIAEVSNDDLFDDPPEDPQIPEIPEIPGETISVEITEPIEVSNQLLGDLDGDLEDLMNELDLDAVGEGEQIAETAIEAEARTANLTELGEGSSAQLEASAQLEEQLITEVESESVDQLDHQFDDQFNQLIEPDAEAVSEVEVTASSESVLSDSIAESTGQSSVESIPESTGESSIESIPESITESVTAAIESPLGAIDVPESDVPESDVPESDVPESDVPESELTDMELTEPDSIETEPTPAEETVTPVPSSADAPQTAPSPAPAVASKATAQKSGTWQTVVTIATTIWTVLLTLWVGLQKVWAFLLPLIRKILPETWNQRLSDRGITAIAISFLLFILWINSLLPANQGAMAKSASPGQVAIDRSGKSLIGKAAPALKTLSPTQLAEVQTQLLDMTDGYAENMVLSVQDNLAPGLLTVTLSPDWYEIGDRGQDRLASAMLKRLPRLKFEQFQLQDELGNLLARSPVVGKTALVLKRDRPPELKVVPPVEESVPLEEVAPEPEITTIPPSESAPSEGV